jgi:undecaprenyl-diphosphatase
MERRPHSLLGPHARLAIGVAGLAATAALARHDQVGHRETAVFQAVNGLPDRLYAPTWVVMQAGTAGASPAAAVVAYAAGRRSLAWRLLTSGTATWFLAKAVKRVVRRARPMGLLPVVRTRGREAAGLGYVSGHAGVSVALAVAALPHLGRTGRAVTAAVPPVVGLARIYVGAHLPLDVAGGASLGLAVEAALALYDERRPQVTRRPGPPPGR